MSEGEDRITNLPGSLLHHILSFVDTRDAARASVLSKRWKYIWRSIPVLHFKCLHSSQVNEFMDFVDRTLELHDESNIQKFSLVGKVELDETRIEKWVSTIVSHNVEELILTLDQTDMYLLPPSLCSCESLVKLTLISPSICFPKHISFPRLDSLMLFGIEFRGDFCSEQLFSSCPILETLLMGNCSWFDMKSFCISNAALKNLMIFSTIEEEGFQSCSLKIHAPSLECLIYEGRVAKDYVLCSFPKLVQANIEFMFDEDSPAWEQESYCAVIKFLRALAHVENLTISDDTLQVLSVADDSLNNLPSFHNLRILSLTQKLTADKALSALLETAPNLMSLRFEGFAHLLPDEEEDDDDESGDDGGDDNAYEAGAFEGEDSNDNGDDGWALDVVASRCSFLHLKIVRFKKFAGNAREMRWLKLILKNAKALEEMDIVSFCDSISPRKSKNLMAKVLSLPRASASCVFKFPSKQG